MSVQGILTVNGQMSLIDPKPRTMDVYYSMPDEPNEKTGLLVLVPGFGGNVHSNVYKKMRSLFADKYNLYVIQCEYFGSKFMQSPSQVDLKDYYNAIPLTNRDKIINNYEENKALLDGVTLEKTEDLNESKSDYAEMGLVQATDILISINSFIEFLNIQDKPLNRKLVLGYGHSHGAYLLYLCNALMPNCFSDLIDISAWLYPMYLDYSRSFFSETDSFPIITFINTYVYLASQIDIDKEAYDLSEYYQTFTNKAAIYSFHGDKDDIITLKDKIKFLSGVSNSSVEVIGENRVDNELFSSNEHGLDADFLKLFDYVVSRYGLLQSDKNREVLIFEDMSFSTSKTTYWLGYDERIDNIQMYIIEK